jgi:hypothetical protein
MAKIVQRQGRQGDVLVIRPLDGRVSVPVDASEIPRENGRVVLAHGEVTGHAHVMRDRNVCMWGAEGLTYDLLRIGEGVVSKLTHEEHGTIQFSPGLYERRIQREYAWSAEAEATSRAVAD